MRSYACVHGAAVQLLAQPEASAGKHEVWVACFLVQQTRYFFSHGQYSPVMASSVRRAAAASGVRATSIHWISTRLFLSPRRSFHALPLILRSIPFGSKTAAFTSPIHASRTRSWLQKHSQKQAAPAPKGGAETAPPSPRGPHANAAAATRGGFDTRYSCKEDPPYVQRGGGGRGAPKQQQKLAMKISNPGQAAMLSSCVASTSLPITRDHSSGFTPLSTRGGGTWAIIGLANSTPVPTLQNPVFLYGMTSLVNP
mmetsp:Transcript_5686/g.19338  ORF Transcript_5686/g.19338 Transcript_5686/m.19338 type:complete len:255 (+) Transcript_5686:849-1613(+)